MRVRLGESAGVRLGESEACGERVRVRWGG